ncbi:MAG: SpoIIE family protein phosphatase [Bdellovibrionota bacterium]
MNKLSSLSIKYKLLILLTTLPVIALTLYLILATRLFKVDKIAYVFDSSAAVSRSLSSQVKAEIESALSALKPIAEGYDPASKSFDRTSEKLFSKEQSFILIEVFKPDKKLDYKQAGLLSKTKKPDAAKKYDKEAFELLKKAHSNTVSLGFLKGKENTVLLAVRYGNADDPSHVVIFAVLELNDFLRIFRKASVYTAFLIDPAGNVITGPVDHKRALPTNFSSWKFYGDLMRKSLSEGTEAILSPEGIPLLMSFSRVGLGNLMVISLVETKTALRAVEILLSKSILFFIALICGTTIVSVFASGTLTSALRTLYEATKTISEGKFDINVKVKSKDEVGALADGFNKMASEVSRLMEENIAKARMEKELETAKVVQETLFPAPTSAFGPLKIAGAFEPASECGGDWWHYCEIGDKVFVWVGDATGHGAPAALITSAAKSAASVIERIFSSQGITPAMAMTYLNRAIYETSKGKMLMTFFVASIDKTTGELTYSNASHDPPYLLRHTGQALLKDDMVALVDATGSRLGQNADSEYKDVTLKLATGDTVVFYTDGLPEMLDKSGKQWGERKFIKSMLTAVSESKEPEQAVSQILTNAKEFRTDAELADDVTLFICKYDQAA